jgi:four helix bundle protein
MPAVAPFNFKRLDVYQAAIAHFVWAVEAVGRIRAVPFPIRNQILSAALSVPANIAEANGRDRKPGEAEQHYRYALGSTYESAALLDALAAMGVVHPPEHAEREQQLDRIAAMIARLMRRQAQRRTP